MGSCPQIVIRTYRAEDECGNVASCTQQITVVDTTPPVISCPANITIECDESIECGGGELQLFSVDRSSDLLREIDPNTAATLSSISISLAGETVLGANGLAAQPGSNTLYAIVRVGSTGSRQLVTIDPTTGVATLVGDAGPGLAGLAFDASGSTLWAVSGNNGSPAESLFELSLINGASTFICTLGNGSDGEAIGFNPDDGKLYHASGHTGAGVIFETVDDLTNDPCGITNIPIGGALDDEEAQALTWWSSEGVFLWKQNHDAGPLFRVTTGGAETLIGTLDHQSKGLALVGDCPLGVATANDICSSTSVTYSDSFSSGCGTTGTIVRTWTAIDECGNDTSCDQIITIVDTTPPSITCPDDITIECGDPVPDTQASSTDNCENGFIVSSDSEQMGSCPWTIIRTFTAVDACGNEATCTQRITIEDTTPPQMTCTKPTPMLCVDFEITSTWLIQNGNAAAYDACDPDPTVYVVDSSDIAFFCSITRTYLFTSVDACGNQGDTCSIIVSFLYDDEPPVVTCSDPPHLGCNPIVPTPQDIINMGLVGATDNCGPAAVGHIPPILGSRDGCDTINMYVFGAADICNNQAVPCTVTVVWTDDLVPPQMTCPDHLTIECDEPIPPFDITDVIAVDACSEATVTFIGDVSDMVPCFETITRTYSATDTCGNVAICTQYITIVDTTPPDLTCPDDVTIECGDPTPASMATVSDNCTLDPFLTQVDSDTIGMCPWVIVRTFTSVDDCDNVSVCTQRIVIEDTLPPQMTCTKPAPFLCTDFVPTSDWLIEMGHATAWDACDPDPLVTVIDSLDLVGPCSTTRTFRFTTRDKCDNQGDTCSIIVTLINDQTPPVLTCTSPPHYGCNPDLSTLPSAQDLITLGFVVGVDNCGPPAIGFVPPFVMDTVGCEVTRTFEFGATDLCGNQAEHCFVVLQWTYDLTPPSVTCADPLVIECDDPIPAPDPSSVTATDFCSTPFVTFVSETVEGDDCERTITRTFIAIDDCGNSATCTRYVIILDTTPPNLTCPDDVTIECGSPLPGQEVFTASDNCQPTALVTYADSDTIGFCPHIIIRTYSTVDECGNAISCTQRITIEDTTPPVLTCPNNITIQCDQDPLDFDLTGVATGSDICDPDPAITVAVDIPIMTTPCLTIIDRVWQATDACGNGASSEVCVQRITIVDTEAPSITCPDNVTIECGDDLPTTLATASDNCDTAPLLTYADAAQVGVCPGTIIRTYIMLRTNVAMSPAAHR